jgi:hypothetical protein
MSSVIWSKFKQAIYDREQRKIEEARIRRETVSRMINEAVQKEQEQFEEYRKEYIAKYGHEPYGTTFTSSSIPFFTMQYDER